MRRPFGRLSTSVCIECLAARNSHQVNQHLPLLGRIAQRREGGALRRNVLGAIAIRKERSQLPDATTTRLNKKIESAITTRPAKTGDYANHYPYADNPWKTLFYLTNSFRKRRETLRVFQKTDCCWHLSQFLPLS